MITTLKHNVANAGDGGRDSNVVNFSERLLREIYFPALRLAHRKPRQSRSCLLTIRWMAYPVLRTSDCSLMCSGMIGDL